MTTNKRANPIYQAQDILSRRDHSEFEVRTKLKRKKFSPQEIDRAINWLYGNKLLNDAAFTQRYIDSILLGKPVGPRWLTQKLREKRIDSSIIEDALAETFAEGKEEELARDAATRWRRSHPSKASDKQKLQNFLISRGFSFDAVGAAAASLDSA